MKKGKIPPQYGEEKILTILMKFRAPLIVALVTIMVASVGYMLISKVDLLRAVYMAVLSVTTIGYGEMWEMSPEARIFNLFVMTFGVGGVMGYSLAVLINVVTSGELKNVLRFRKMVRDISALKGHYLVFGKNDITAFLIRELKGYRIPVVLVDNSEDLEKFAEENQVKYYLKLDPAEENSLYLANIEAAVGAIVAVMDDYKSLAITLTVKNVVRKENICPFFILAVAGKEEFKEKLRLVGADYVETFPSIISKRLTTLARKPPIFGEKSVLEEILFGERTFIDIEEFVVEPDSPVAGKTLKELDLKNKFGITVIAIKKSSGKIIFTPSGNTTLDPLDIMVVVAPKDKLEDAIPALFKGKLASRSVVLKRKIKERLNGLG